MNVSCSILFLGWWLLGLCQMSRGELYPKPHISIHPRGMVALGGNVSIRCWTESEKHVEYYLTKEVNRSATTPSVKVADPRHVVFPIVNARISDGGSYWCLYHNKSSNTKWSPQSDIVYINLTDTILPKPAIEMIPTNEIAPGLNVTIQCRGPENGLTFALYKANMQVAFQATKPETDTAEFLFVMLTLEDAGNYTCQYHQRGSPFVWSEPSQPVELVFRGQDDSVPSISVCPSAVVALGGNVTIRCKSEIHQQKKFVLVKESLSQKKVVMQEKQAEKYEVTFSIANAEYLDGGTYWCHFQISPQEWSKYSEKACIWITKQIYPKPSISVSPKELVPLGARATIHCKNEDNSKALYSLIKEGAPDIIQVKTGNKKEAVFTIDNVDQSKVGIYWCDYSPDRDNRYSNFSERVYINITDPDFPKPSIKMAPQGQHILGESVTILCEGPENNLIFFLHKSMDLRASKETEPGSNGTTFLVQIISSEDADNYTCQYHKSGNPFVWSVPSNPAQLVVEDRNQIIMWASIAAGCLFLFLLGLLLACKLYRKRRKGSTAKATNQPAAMTLGLSRPR